jgi:predicted Rdx family selenoprotein
MAQRVITELVDDLDGTALAEGKGETVAFSIDGVEYNIDLSDKNAAKLRKAVQPYIDAGRKVGGQTRRRRSGSKGSSNGDAQAIREWAAENGIELSARGRIPAGVMEQYRAAS